jgi:hypothetical protein
MKIRESKTILCTKKKHFKDQSLVYKNCALLSSLRLKKNKILKYFERIDLKASRAKFFLSKKTLKALL